MIIDEHITIYPKGKEINYWREKGYTIETWINPKAGKESVRRGTPLKVKVTDLPPKSTRKVRRQCDTCGRIDKVGYGHVKHTGTTDCPQCARDKMTLSRGESQYRTYKQSAIRRGLTFDLSYEDFIEIADKPCHFCGTTSYKFYHNLRCANGLDRWDNTKGYTKENLVPCCGTCNHMKACQTPEDFIAHCGAVAKHNPAIKARTNNQIRRRS